MPTALRKEMPLLDEEIVVEDKDAEAEASRIIHLTMSMLEDGLDLTKKARKSARKITKVTVSK